MQTLLLYLVLATAAADTTAQQRVYVLGSSINLRKEPSTDAEVLEKLQIGTECLSSEKLQEQWLKVRCGEKEGYASASLLGTEKPSVEKLKAEAMNSKLKLEQREDSALRAATLAPENAELQKLLGTIFFERNLALAAGIKKPAMRRTFKMTCFNQTEAACIEDAAAASVKDVKVRTKTKDKLFVIAIGNAESVVIYRGKYQFNPKTQVLTGEVLEQTAFATTPVMEKALFDDLATRRSEKWALPLGQFSLNEDAHTLLNAIPKEWGVLEPSPPEGFLKMPWDDCLKRPYQLRFVPDMHGRWLLSNDLVGHVGSAETYWISAVSKRGNELDLTLEGYYGGTKHEVFKLPVGRGDIAYLGNKAYSFKLNRYAEVHHPCLEGGP